MRVCGVEDCESKVICSGFCDKHYRRFKRYGDPLGFFVKEKTYCSLDNCNKPHKGHGFCNQHYQRFKKHGDPNFLSVELHGMDGTPEYFSWVDMRRRCYNPKRPAYKDYGGRGIKVCDSWNNSFIAFFENMGYRPSENHTLDRIDNEGDYTPENCRWATKEVQSRNQRIYVNNKTGVKGVSWDEKGKRWISSIYNNKKAISLGRYTVFKDAVEARLDAEEKYWGFRTEYNIEL